MIDWGKKAEADLDEIVDWLNVSGFSSSIPKLLERIDETIAKVHNHPTIGKPAKPFKTVRSYRIDKHRRLFYSVNGRKVTVVQIWDSRQDPEKNRY